MGGGAANARNVALLVGVGQFRDPALQTEQLLGTAADIDAVQKSLTGRWGFAPGDIRVLRDQGRHARPHFVGDTAH